MSTRLITSSSSRPSRMIMAIALAACLIGLAVWCFRQPVRYGPAPKFNLIVREAGYQQAGPQPLSPQLVETDARHYLEQTGEGQSLEAAIATASYSISKVEHASGRQQAGDYEAFNPAHALAVCFQKGSVQVRSSKGRKWHLGLRLKGYGYGDQLAALPPIVSHQVKGNRIEYERQNLGMRISDFESEEDSLFNPQSTIRHPQLIEWYKNTPEGLEQGFTLPAPPVRRSQRTKAPLPLRLALDLSGDLHGKLSRDGQSLRLHDRRGSHLSTYNHLRAWDATGRELTARMRLRGKELSLEVDDAGASYPLTIDPTLWQQQYQLKATDAAAGARFGNAVAISGNTAIVGAIESGGIGQGAAYVFVRNGSKWQQEQKLTAADFGRFPERFGASVAISGNTAVVGANFTTLENNTGGVNQQQGAAYVYVRTGSVWSPKQMLTADDGKPGDQFGSSIAINGDTLIAAAFVHFHERFTWQGAAYVFTRTNGIWSQQQELTGDQAVGSLFAANVALSGETAIIRGANPPSGIDVSIGKVYFFDRSGDVWTETQELTANDRLPGDYFTSVAISGDTAFVGYSNTSPDNVIPADPSRQGAYVFTRNSGAWSQLQRLTIGVTERPRSGFSVALDRDTAILGFPNFNDSDVTNGQGAAYLFVRAGALWFEEKKLTAADSRAGDHFGSSVAINGETAVVGSFEAAVDGHPAQGSAYVFLRSPDTDGDGLPDDWEKNGVTIDGEFIDLPAMGANELHKDIFIHADWMGADPSRPGVLIKPDRKAIKIVVDSFATAPVENPDHRTGISLHVDLGPTSVLNYLTGDTNTWGAMSRASEVPFQTKLGSIDSAGNFNWGAVDSIKALHFTPAKRRAIFHYALFANNYDPGSSGGLSRGFNGADFIVTLGDWSDPGGTLLEQAGTFMHELGHNLGLHHGGEVDTNGKPNYLSIMNYTFQNVGVFQPLGRQRSYDFSRELLPPLDERNLDEFVGIRDPGMHLTLWDRHTRPNIPPGSNKCLTNPGYFRLFFPTDALDWNCDGLKTATPVVADINGDGQTNVITGFKDWPAIVFDGAGSIGALGAGPVYPMTTHIDEPTLNQIRDLAPEGLREEEFAAPLDIVTVSPFQGAAPLIVTLDGSASTAVNGTITKWEWNFGDGTSGLGATVVHSYMANGEYFASLTVTDNNGRVNLVPLRYRILVADFPSPTPTPTPAGTLPNLTPYQPAGWSDLLVVSKVTGTNTDSANLIATDSLYLDLSAINNGNGPTAASFSMKLYVDGVALPGFAVNQSLNPAAFVFLEDFPLGSLGAGQHSIKIAVDADGEIGESNESDNEYVRIVNIAAAPTPSPTATPSPSPTASPTPTPGPTPASGSFTVNTTGDQTDPNTADGRCDVDSVTAGDQCTLRAAIAQTNADGGADTISFNFPPGAPGCNAGTNVCTISPASPLPTIRGPVTIDGYTQPGASTNKLAVGNNAVLLVELSGLNLATLANGLSFATGGEANLGSVVIRGLVINGFGFSGLSFGDDDEVIVEGCFIGTNTTGNVALGNQVGIFMGRGFFGNGRNSRIGGPTPAQRNLISGNFGSGLVINGRAFTAVSGNYIGTNASGNGSLGNGAYGIAGSNFGGVTLAGVNIGGVTNKPGTGSGNVISGNAAEGVLIEALPATTIGPVTIQGNIIGLNGAGTTALGNSGGGIHIFDHNLNGGGPGRLGPVTVGGAETGAGNLISANRTTSAATAVSGIVTTAMGTIIRGNFIGTDITGTLDLGNDGFGILAGGGIGGGNALIAGNTIAYSGLRGVSVQDPGSGFPPITGISILGNSIFSNTKLGIDLDNEGVNLNDTGDGDSGANNRQNFPVVTSARSGGGSTTVTGTLNSTPLTTFTLEFFSNPACDSTGFGEGQTFLCSAAVTTNATGNVDYTITFPFAVPIGQMITATATSPPAGTDPTGNTSEFSACVPVNEGGPTLPGGSNSSTLVSSACGGVPTPTPTPTPTQTTVQFSAPNFQIVEDCTRVLLTVTRSGVLNGAVAVDFATNDGSALQRTDYTISVGTVSFAAGETSKLFELLITEDNYLEGSEQFTVTLNNPVGAALGNQSVATVTINDDDTVQTPVTNPIDEYPIFVGQTYHDFLSRQADSGGQSYWTTRISSCGADLLCIKARRVEVSNAFYFEQEYQQTGAYVFRLYRAAYGNNQPFPNPDGANLAEAKKLPSYSVFVPDRSRVVGGIELAQSQLALANIFVQRPEFLAKYPTGLDGPSFIAAILNTIKIDTGADLTAQQNVLLTIFNSGGRGAVLYRLADDNTLTNPVNNRAFIDAEYRRAFVTTQYFGYLRRDGDIAGLLFWLSQVNGFPLRNSTIQNAMVCAFITSTEYQQRFSSVVTRNNAHCP